MTNKRLVEDEALCGTNDSVFRLIAHSARAALDDDLALGDPAEEH
jgi:hypothetical protein